jgi:flagellar basal body-associated protein FliL
MQRKTKVTLLIVAIVLVLAGTGFAIFLMYRNIQTKNQAITEMSQQFEVEKEQLTDEYSKLALQYEGYGLRVGNDSLANLLDQQRYKVQRILEELRTVKASNVKRITQLKKELETLRSVMRQYVIQIDSLNALNTQLRSENKLVTQRYTEEQQKTQSLTEEKKELINKVTLASILEARNITVESLNEKGKKATKINKTAQLRFSFLINKNISAKTGEKYIYIRILQPDETALVKKNDNVFLFENKYINYSARRPIDYEGEEVPVTIYWDVEEFLHPGAYRVDVFADGYQIGSARFSLKD